MEINIIVAADENNGIGSGNQLLCRLSKDLKNFKELTTGHVVVMGRKTFESLPKGALPNRTNIVMSKSEQRFPGCYTCTSADEVLDLAKKHEKIFIIGGESIYKEFFDRAHRIYRYPMKFPPTKKTNIHFSLQFTNEFNTIRL